VEKTNFTTFGPPCKILEKSLGGPLEKIVPTPMLMVSMELRFGEIFSWEVLAKQ